jgi:glycosyltransferase involved in cell wall biosynthesis
MNIAIDINGITATSGLANYLRLLIKGLAAADRKNRYFLYLHSWNLPLLPPGTVPAQPNFSVITQRVPQQAELIGERLLGLKLAEPFLLKHGIDVFHGPSNILPKLSRIKSVLTLHHYMPLDHPFFSKHLGRMERFYFRATDNSLAEAAHVITVSEYTRRYIVDRFALDPAAVTAIHEGPSEQPPAPAPGRVRELLAGFGLTGEYLLFVGPINERKNLLRLLDAFALAGASLAGVKLAVSGDGAPSYMALVKDRVDELGLRSRVIFTGRTGPEQAAALYAGAAALCYPSLFEGFGYPPLEAMAAGCPVAASNATAIPEVVGKASLLFDPENTEEMAAALVRAATDKELRAGLIAAGRQRAADFSWDKTAAATLAVYEKLYAS